jgi:hypothetical protein
VYVVLEATNTKDVMKVMPPVLFSETTITIITTFTYTVKPLSIVFQGMENKKNDAYGKRWYQETIKNYRSEQFNDYYYFLLRKSFIDVCFVQTLLLNS